jgi:1,4-alpha-glucan branching enzyme
LIKVSPPQDALANPLVALLKERSGSPPEHTIAFEYVSLDAREVFVAGTFNDWQPRATPLAKQPGGRWSTTLTLKPGTYEYRLIVDGQWQDDPRAAGFTANPFGGLNSVIEVKP